jgi:acetolactate synthase-1/2/3 large subunit
MTTVGELIVETLAAHDIDRVFCVPGESYLGLLDALYGRSDVDTVVCRHESGAGFMALADARLSGRPGVVCVSRGPGASNAAIAVHTAQQDGVPLILLVGQVAARDVRRDSFQEIDYGKMFGSIAKWTAEITDPERAAETMLRALQTATIGVPGPVVIAVPEDVLTAQCTAKVVKPQAPITSAPSAAALTQLHHLLASAQRPLVISGSGIDRPGEREKLLAFLEAWELPSVVSFRCQDLLPNDHRLYAGDMGLSNPESQMRVLEQADLIVVLGARLTDITTQGYTFPTLVRPSQHLVHIHSDPMVIGSHFASDLSIACSAMSVIDSIGRPEKALPDRAQWIAQLGAERRKIAAVRSFDVDDGVPFELVVDLVGRQLSKDAIVTLDAGTFGAPAYRVIDFKPPQRLLAPISGAMGFGVPAAVAASLREPKRDVICFVGDGGLLMTGSELTVAMERKLPLKVIVSENRVYASILIHQERGYPGRAVGTSFVNPDLDLIGRAYGFAVTRISKVSQFADLAAALRSPGPQFIVVDTSIKAILPKPAAIRAAAE